MNDRLYIRHPALPVGQTYEIFGGIPDHKYLEDQSANSERLNTPSGDPRNVLFDTKNGQHYWTYQIARVDVSEVRELNIPNPHTIVYDENNNIKAQQLFTFRPEHKPTPCMYPHCEIIAYRNGTKVKKVASGVTTAIRLEFGRIAESHRVDMLKFQRPHIQFTRVLWSGFAALQSLAVYMYHRARVLCWDSHE